MLDFVCNVILVAKEMRVNFGWRLSILRVESFPGVRIGELFIDRVDKPYDLIG